FRVAAAPLRSEGTFLVEQRGTVIKLGTGERVVVFHADKSGKRERPMVLLACQKLQQMEQMATDRGETPVFVVSGQVFAYQNVNYLLPTLARMVAEAPAGAGAGGGAGGPGTSPPKNPAAEPGVQELIKELEAQREAGRGPE